MHMHASKIILGSDNWNSIALDKFPIKIYKLLRLVFNPALTLHYPFTFNSLKTPI